MPFGAIEFLSVDFGHSVVVHWHVHTVIMNSCAAPFLRLVQQHPEKVRQRQLISHVVLYHVCRWSRRRPRDNNARHRAPH